MDETVFERGITADSTIPERLESLVQAGVAPEVLAEDFGVGESTVNSWRLGAIPTPKTVVRLDGMIETVRTLIEEGLDPEEAVTKLGLPENQEDEIDAGAKEEKTETAQDKKDMLVYEGPTPSGLGENASVEERLDALVDAGLSLESIAEASGVATQTVERWIDQKTRLQKRSFAKLNKLRGAMEALIESGLDPETAAIWMQTPLICNKENIPVNVIAYDHKIIFHAIDRLFVQKV